MQAEKTAAVAAVWFLGVIFLTGFALAAIGVIASSRFGAFRRVVLGKGPTLPDRLLVGLAGGLMGVLVTRLVFVQRAALFLPLLAGYHGGRVAGMLAGGCLMGWMMMSGAHPTVLVASFGSGIVGGLIGRLRGKGDRLLLSVTGGILTAIALAYSPRFRGGLMIESASFEKLLPFLALFGLLTGGAIWGLSRLVEYLALEEERQTARVAAKVLRLADQTFRVVFKEGNPYPELCGAVAQAMEAPGCVAITREGELIPARETRYPHTFRDKSIPEEVRTLFDNREIVAMEHRTLFSCEECPFGEILLFPLHGGDAVQALLGIFAPRRYRFTTDDRSLVSGISALLSFELVTRRLRRQDALLEEARYQFLAAQIRPHFLFNALNTIASFIHKSPAEAEGLLVQLSHFLLQSFTLKEKLIPLGKELEHLESYLAIEKARFGDRLRVAFEVDELARQHLLPPMLLQPLVENAIRHGISVKPEGGTVRVRATLQEAGMELEVADDGVGFAAPDAAGERGVGLSNVRERIERVAGRTARFQVSTSPGKGTSISFFLPTLPSSY